jgi:hypothetical protein
MAACLGMGVAFVAGDFFLILEAAIQFDYRAEQRQTPVLDSQRAPPLFGTAYFLNRLSNAARASLAFRGAATMLPVL